MGLVIGGIWIAAVSVRENQQASSLSRDVLQICMQAKNIFPYQMTPATGSSGSRRGISVATGRAGLAPSSWQLRAASTEANNCCTPGQQTLWTPDGYEALIQQFDQD